MSSIEAQELERLSEADKNDLRKFLATEQQKTSIQARSSSSRALLLNHKYMVLDLLTMAGKQRLTA
jgi:hypothetical protein